MKKYSRLPMLMSQEQITKTVEEILSSSQIDTNISNIAIAEALMEMLMRQTAHYTTFENKIIPKIEQWIVKNWDHNSAPFVDICATLIASTKMQQGKQLLEEAAENAPNLTVREIAKETLIEINDTWKKI